MEMKKSVLLKNIQCMMGISHHILPFAGGQVIFYKKRICLFVHFIYFLPDMICIAVRCHEMKLCHIKMAAQTVNIFFSAQFKQIPGIGESTESMHFSIML